VENPSKFYIRVKLTFLDYLLLNVISVIEMMTDIPACSEPLNSMMDSFGDLYRYVSLSGVDENIFEYFAGIGDIR